MSDKYKRSFEIDDDEIPRKCPGCGTDFDLTKDVDIDYYKDGIRSVLICPNENCNLNYQKVISYKTNSDLEKEMEEDEEFGEDGEDEEDKMSKEEMLREMDEVNWPHDLSEESSWDEIKEEYDNMIDECSDNSDLFPNGRDYDAEDEDGPF